jgi:ABC-2 type transport system ATP-binding protein
MSTSVIRAEALSKRYSPTSLAVDRLDLDIVQGEVFGLLGPNGAGKTTTILMALGLTEPTSGTIETVGFDPLRQPLEVKRRVGYLPDSVGFYDHMTGRDNLRYTARLGGIPRKDIDARITQALSRVNLLDAGAKPVATYSRGMRQRLGIAEIVMRKVEVAILDEPTNGLDPQSTREFLELIRSLKGEGMTIVLSSHLLDLVQTICDRVALFSNGRIGLMGSVQTLMRDVLGGTTVVQLEAAGIDADARLAGIPGLERITKTGEGVWRIDATRDVRSDVAKRVVESGGELKALSIGAASLDEVYARYFEKVRNAARFIQAERLESQAEAGRRSRAARRESWDAPKRGGRRPVVGGREKGRRSGRRQRAPRRLAVRRHGRCDAARNLRQHDQHAHADAASPGVYGGLSCRLFCDQRHQERRRQGQRDPVHLPQGVHALAREPAIVLGLPRLSDSDRCADIELRFHQR